MKPKRRGPRRGLLSRTEAWEVLGPYADQLHGWLQDAWDWVRAILTQDPERDATLDSSTVAGMVSDRFAFLLEAELDEDHQVQLARTGRMLRATIDGQVTLRFKKLDRRLRSSNIDTHNQENIYCQHLLGNFGVRPTNVTFGYVASPTGTAIAAVHFTCPLDWSRNLWAIQLAGLDEEGAFLFDPHGFGDIPADAQVAPKKARKASRG
jgi:hypothetical protein